MPDEDLISDLEQHVDRFERAGADADPREAAWAGEATACAARLRSDPTDEYRDLAAALLDRARRGFAPATP